MLVIGLFILGLGGIKYSCIKHIQTPTSAAGQTCLATFKEATIKPMSLHVKRSNGDKGEMFWDIEPGIKEFNFYEPKGTKFKIELIERMK